MIDRIQARALGLSIGDVNGTLAIAFGSAYANDFNRAGRILRVLLQAEASHRMTPQDVLALKVRNAAEIGRASCRDRGCTYVQISVGAHSSKKKKKTKK